MLSEKQINKLKTIKTHTFIDKQYKISWKKPRPTVIKVNGKTLKKQNWGECESPDTKNKTITIYPRISEKHLLSTMVDESIHACIWPLENDYVDEMSNSIAEFLWRAGWRLS